ncbi:Nesprin-1 [Frankliniella fusca]|uniref:Nesprin-1 n=1 Tax=Frankliniella fusca TaxID=407009 RepID=A0AAE1I0W8_9NEOP|nr:Nesprin-1 [Frankliniella fusca]
MVGPGLSMLTWRQSLFMMGGFLGDTAGSLQQRQGRRRRSERERDRWKEVPGGHHGGQRAPSRARAGRSPCGHLRGIGAGSGRHSGARHGPPHPSFHPALSAAARAERWKTVRRGAAGGPGARAVRGEERMLRKAESAPRQAREPGTGRGACNIRHISRPGPGARAPHSRWKDGARTRTLSHRGHRGAATASRLGPALARAPGRQDSCGKSR